MLSLQEPSPDTIRRFLTAQAASEFTYSAVGATAGQPPAGFVVAHTRIKLGEGEKIFQLGRAGLQRWEQFNLGWLEAYSPEMQIRPGEVMAVVARVAGLWWLNACRIVYVIDEEGPIQRFGCAYGTLPDHAASGEERFLVEWNRADKSVWYDILSFSRPRHILARIGYPMFRRKQKQFGRESAAAMLRVVRASKAPPPG
jgi:uncharacterized protein (UPF0548 family)